MHTGTAKLQLSAIEVPTPKLSTSVGIVEWGKSHNFMREVLELIRHSPTARAMCSRRALFTAGQGFVTDAEKYPVLAAFLKKIAPSGKHRTARKLLRRIAKDFAKLRAFALQVVWSKDGKFITELYHQRIETVACGPLNAEDEIEMFLLCRDWSQKSKYPPQPIMAFNPERAKQDGVQLLYYFDEDSGTECYPELELAPVLNYMKVEGRLSRYTDNRVATRFGIDTIISILKGPEDLADPLDPMNPNKVRTAKSQRKEFEEGVKNKFQGEDADAILFLWGTGETDDADKMAKVQSVTTVTPETFKTTSDEARQNILSVGGVTSPVVIGLPGGGTLGGDGAEIREAFEMYFNSVCRPDQVAILEVFYDDILPRIQGIEADLPGLDADKPALDIETTLPVKFMFDNATLESILDDDELRNMINFGPRKTAAEAEDDEQEGKAPAPTEAQLALAGSPAGQSSIDSMLGLLAQGQTTRESCIARLKTFFGLSQEQAEAIVPLLAKAA